MIKKLIISIALALFTVSGMNLSAQEAEEKTAQNALIDAVGQYNNRNFKDSKRILNFLVKSAPDNDAAHYYLGLSNLYLYDLEGAATELKKAASLDSSNYWYRDGLAYVYQLQGKEELTEQMYEKLLKDFHKKSDLYYDLVDIYLKQNQYDKALATLDNIDTIFGKDEAVATTRYQIYRYQNKPAEAVKALQDYNKENSSPSVLSMLGDYEMSEYKDSLAMSYYDEALSLARSYTPALLGKAEVYRSRRDYDHYFGLMENFVNNEDIEPQVKSKYLEALLQRGEPRFMMNFRPRIDSLFQSCIEHHPNDSTTLQTAGLYYYATQRYDQAKSYLQKNAINNPGSVSAVATYVQMLAYMKDWNEVIKVSDKAIVNFPHEMGFYQSKNQAYYFLKDYQNIIATSEQMIKVAPNDTSVTLPAYSTIGDMYHELGNNKQAFKYYDKALAINPDYIPVLNNYAYYLSTLGWKLKKAYQMSERTVRKEPDNATYLDTFGWILHLQGKDVEAKPQFKHAMLYGGKDSATILFHYAEVLYALKDYDLAVLYWNQAKAKNNGEDKIIDKLVDQRLKSVKSK